MSSTFTEAWLGLSTLVDRKQCIYNWTHRLHSGIWQESRGFRAWQILPAQDALHWEVQVGLIVGDIRKTTRISQDLVAGTEGLR